MPTLLDLDPAESFLVSEAIKQINSVSEKEFFGQAIFLRRFFAAHRQSCA